MKLARTSLKPLEIWRPDVNVRDAVDFGRSLAVVMLRGGSGGTVTQTGARPQQRLVLYEREDCPYSRLVREALSRLDLDALIKPCPPGEEVHRAELRDLSGEERVPFLIDDNTYRRIHDSHRIVSYLFERYGSGPVPAALRFEILSELTSKAASYARGFELRYRAPSQQPERPLELWNYEASPYCRRVRERLSELGLPYVSHNLARHSPRRAAFAERYGRLQFPRLADPNTSFSTFESEDIVSYLDATYGAGHARDVRGAALMQQAFAKQIG